MSQALLKIPDSEYYSTGGTVSTQLQPYGYEEYSRANVIEILKSYVYFASNKIVPDYPTAAGTDKADIAARVMNDVSTAFHYVPMERVQNVLNTLSLLAQDGRVNLMIAYPQKWELQLEAAETVSQATTKKTPALQAGINSFFSGIGEAFKSALSGLGLNLNVILVVLVAGVIIYFLILYKGVKR